MNDEQFQMIMGALNNIAALLQPAPKISKTYSSVSPDEAAAIIEKFNAAKDQFEGQLRMRKICEAAGIPYSWRNARILGAHMRREGCVTFARDRYGRLFVF
jgi:hypothetical protein